MPRRSLSIVQPAGFAMREIWQLGRDTSHVSAGLEYPISGRLEMDPGGQSRGYSMASLQTVPCHIAGMGALSCWFQQSYRFAGHVTSST